MPSDQSAVSVLIQEVLSDPDLAHDDVFRRLLQAGLQDLRACPVFCVSVLQVGVDSVGVGGGELGQGLVPVGGDLSFDELALGPALGCWQSFLLVAFSGSFVHGCRRSPAFGSLITASSEGKWPRFLETLRSW